LYNVKKLTLELEKKEAARKSFSGEIATRRCRRAQAAFGQQQQQHQPLFDLTYTTHSGSNPTSLSQNLLEPATEIKSSTGVSLASQEGPTTMEAGSGIS
jgi:hypothetical protein